MTPRGPRPNDPRLRPLEPVENGEVRDVLDARRMRKWLIAHARTVLIWGGGSALAVVSLRDQIKSVLDFVMGLFGGGTS